MPEEFLSPTQNISKNISLHRERMQGGVRADLGTSTKTSLQEGKFSSWLRGRRAEQSLNDREYSDDPRFKNEVKPPFVNAFEEAMNTQVQDREIIELGLDAAAKLSALSPQEAINALTGRSSASEVLAARKAFSESNLSKEQLEGQVTDALTSRATEDRRRQEGRYISGRAIKTYENWLRTERMVTADQLSLKNELDGHRDTILSTGTGNLGEKMNTLARLGEVSELIRTGQEHSIRLLRKLTDQADGVLSSNGQNVEIQLEEHVEQELKQRLGVEIQLTPEDDLLTHERIEAAFNKVLIDARIDPAYGNGKYKKDLMNKLGVKEVEEDGKKQLRTEESSILRATILADDAVEAATKAFTENLDNADPDYAYATFFTAHEKVQADCLQTISQSKVKDVCTEVFASQQSAIHKEINNIQKAEKIDAWRSKIGETTQETVRKVGFTIRRGIRSLQRIISDKVSSMAKLEDRDQRASERQQHLSDLQSLLKLKT